MATQIQTSRIPAAAAPATKSKIKVSPLVAGYITLGVVGGGSFLALYGVILTYLVRTFPDTSQELSEDQKQLRKLRQTMVGLTVVIGAVGIIFGIITGAKTRGQLRTGIFLLLFSAISAFFLISTSITYTQDARITGDYASASGAIAGDKSKKIKTGTEVGLIVSAISTAAFGGATAALLYKYRDVIFSGSKKIGAEIKQAASTKQASQYLVQKSAAGGAAGGQAPATAAVGAAGAIHQSAKQHQHQVKQAKKAAKEAAKQAKKSAQEAAKQARQTPAATATPASTAAPTPA